MASAGQRNEDFKVNQVFDVSKLVAVITGGGSGLGLMMTQALVSNGAKVYITGRRKEALDGVVNHYNTGPGEIIALPGDVSSREEATRLAEEVSKNEANGIHLLVNNAGIARDDDTKYSNGQPDMKSAEEISKHLLLSKSESWQETFQTNIVGQYYMSAAFLPLLAKGHETIPGYRSSIVNVASISGVMKGSSGGQFAYATSKAGYLQLSKMLATTFKDVGVRVNCIAPGVFPSEMTAGKAGDDRKSSLSGKATNPAGRFGCDMDMAGCILFLAGPAGVFMNGQVLYPEGGHLLTQPATV